MMFSSNQTQNCGHHRRRCCLGLYRDLSCVRCLHWSSFSSDSFVSASMPSVATSYVASISSSPNHCRMRINIYFHRYKRTSSGGIFFLRFSCRRYDRSSIGDILSLILSLMALSEAVYLVLDNVELCLSPWCL